MAGLDFSGRTALVTGAASGIGAAVAQWLDWHDIAELVLVDIDGAGLDALELNCKARRFAGSVADEALWDRIESEVERIDHAAIVAGIADGCPITSQSFEKWRQIQSVNLDGTFLALRTSLRKMEPAGTGSVVLTSSVAGTKPMAYTSAYGSSKAAVVHLAKVAAAEMAKTAIRVNAVAPGRVDTPIWTKTAQFDALVRQLGSEAAALAELRRQAAAESQGVVVTAEMLAGQIGFLLSDDAVNITGTVLVSDGGYSL